MADSPLHFTLRELRAIYTSPRALGGMAIVALILGVAGPFGTYADFNVVLRVAYWGAIVAATYAAGIGSTLLVQGWLRARIAQPLVRAAIGGACGGVPVTAVVLAVNLAAYGNFGMDPLALLAYCVPISIGVALITMLLAGSPGAAPALPEATPAPDAPPPILGRVPLPQRGRLLALSVSDHYVEVITDRGKTLVLMRLGDAMRETGSVAGLQIHRSHWVALDAVQKVARAGGKPVVTLSNGMTLPVSRGFLPAARATGLVG